MKLNQNFNNLDENYLFSKVGQAVLRYRMQNPTAKIINLGIGDVTLPLSACVVEAGKKALDEMQAPEGFRGYGPYEGYEFLRREVSEYYRNHYKIDIDRDEIFIGSGAKEDMGGILNLFATDNKVLIPNPVYPAYLDVNMMDGRTVEFICGTEDNNFLPMPDYRITSEIIYLCSPNNPTGQVYDREMLSAWVNYAIANNAIILFDAAYKSYITESDKPRSIFEIEGARSCAIEFCSFSKTAGFTGVRCSYTIIPNELMMLKKLWKRHLATKTNGVSYITQKMAQAIYLDKGIEEVDRQIKYYLENARLLREAFDKIGMKYYGGVNAPYIWLKCGEDSWKFFDDMLYDINVVVTPGIGFGTFGEGFVRIATFGKREDIIEAAKRIQKKFGKK